MKRVNFIVLIDLARGNLAACYFAKQAIGVVLRVDHGSYFSLAMALRSAFSSIPLIPSRRSNSAITSAGVKP